LCGAQGHLLSLAAGKERKIGEKEAEASAAGDPRQVPARVDREAVVDVTKAGPANASRLRARSSRPLSVQNSIGG